MYRLVKLAMEVRTPEVLRQKILTHIQSELNRTIFSGEFLSLITDEIEDTVGMSEELEDVRDTLEKKIPKEIKTVFTKALNSLKL